MNELDPVNRRRFFRVGLKELLRPISRALDPIERVARQLQQMDLPQPPLPRSQAEEGKAAEGTTEVKLVVRPAAGTVPRHGSGAPS